MNIDLFPLHELDKLPLSEQIFHILSDIQELTRSKISQYNNLPSVNFNIPMKMPPEEFLGENAEYLINKTFKYIDLVKHNLVKKRIITYSIGTQTNPDNTEIEKLFYDSFAQYLETIEKRMTKEATKIKDWNMNTVINESDIEGEIKDPNIAEVVKDIIEFVYIYRYNTKDPEKVMQFLNQVYDAKYGEGFLGRNMVVYQAVEQEVENLKNIPDKIKYLDEKIKYKTNKTILFYSVFFWFYARGEITNIDHFIRSHELPLSFREHLISLLLRRCEIRSNDERIKITVNRSKNMLKELVNKIISSEIPPVTKEFFEKLMAELSRLIPDHFDARTVKRINESFSKVLKNLELNQNRKKAAKEDN